MRRKRILSALECDSDHDYYAQFDDCKHLAKGSGAFEPDCEDDEPQDDDCDYWKSNCYGRG